MALLLKPVPALQGARWMRDGFRLFGKHPLAFSVLLVSFLLTALVFSMVPFVGPMVVVASLPLLSLGFMVASEASLSGQPIHPGHFITPLLGHASRGGRQLTLCVTYGVATMLVMLISDAVDDGKFEKLQRLMGQSQSSSEVEQLLRDPQLFWGVVTRFGLIALLSVPFWHAPALVHWGGQGPAQALFSSTLAVWRSRSAFAVYLLSWLGIIVAFGVTTALLAGLLSAREMAGMMLLPSVLIFSTVFYVSLLFTFNDSFGGSGVRHAAP
ncbi:MAG: BPSS1780 family membrane protein [Rubrivivax sp.]